MKFFSKSTLGLQPWSIIVGRHLATRFRQVSILHLKQLKRVFQQLVENHARCGIQLKTIVSASHRLSNEDKILLGSGKDKMTRMKIGVHLMKVTDKLRFIKREEVMQDVKHCRFPKSGGIRNTMTGDHWAVLRHLINATEAPAEVPAEQTEVPGKQTEYSQVDGESVSSPMCPMSPPMNPRLLTILKSWICNGTCADACPMVSIVLTSPDSKSALDLNALLVRMGSIQSDYGTDTESSAESGATAVETPMHATGADSGAGTAGNPVFPRKRRQLNQSLFTDQEKVMPINPCLFIGKRTAQQEEIKDQLKVSKKPAAA